jgi:hypothetical protein
MMVGALKHHQKLKNKKYGPSFLPISFIFYGLDFVLPHLSI